MKPVKQGVEVILVAAVVAVATYRAATGVNPFSSATWVLGAAIGLGLISLTIVRHVRTRSRQYALTVGSVFVCVAAVSFSAGVVYTMSTAFVTPHVFTSYFRELSAPMIVCVLVMLMHVGHGYHVARSKAPLTEVSRKRLAHAGAQ